MHRECNALLSEIKTEEELDAVIAQRCPAMLVAAMRVYTPTRDKMRELCMQLERNLLRAVAGQVPSAFDSLEPMEVLGVKKGCQVELTPARWEVALVLAKARPSWAPRFLLELRNIVPNKLGEEGEKLMIEFFEIAFVVKQDMAEMMPYFCVFQPELYAKLRASLLEAENVASYFQMMFPQLLRYLQKSTYTYFSAIEVEGELKNEEDIYAWLRIGVAHLREYRVYQMMLDNMHSIKAHILPALFDNLVIEMVESAQNCADLYTLCKFANADQQENLFLALVEKAEATNKGGGVLQRVFPFKGMSEALIIRAIKVLVGMKQFPVEQVRELSEAMQVVAFEELETQSQIETINEGDVNALIGIAKLYPRAEKHLLNNGLEKIAFAYFQRVQIDPTTFSWILQSMKISLKFKESLIFRYAEKWGLNQSEYMQIMQSRLNSQAAFLKKYLRDE